MIQERSVRSRVLRQGRRRFLAQYFQTDREGSSTEELSIFFVACLLHGIGQ